MAYRNFSGALLPDTNQQAGVRYVNGSWADEYLSGSSGADQFEGGGGRDTMAGGAGDDFYWVRDTRDVVVEHAGGGVDTIKIWSSYTLSPNVENLIVFGDGSYAAGNEQNNIVQGLEGSQFLYGGRGEDVLIGGSGNDIFIVRAGEGNKVIEDFQSWGDKLRLIGGNLTSFEAVKGAMSQVGSDVVLNSGGTMIAFRNASVDQFTARDFELPMNLAALGQRTFSDEFDSLQTGSVWKTNFGYAGDGLNSFTLPNNGELQVYVSPDFKGTTGASMGLNPYAIDGGVLTITAQPVFGATSASMWGFGYSSGMLMSHHAQTYGYFEVRAELPHGKGLWPAFWLLGPDNNEIDILEGLGSDTKVPFNAIHSNAVPALGFQNFVPDDAGFHTYGALWSPSDIIFYVDGTEVWRTATPHDMNKPMQMIVNLAVGGSWAGPPDGSTPWPGQMKIDYVRAYNLADPNAPPPPPVAPPPVTSPPPTTSDAGVVLTSSYPGATLHGGAGNDTLNASQGSDQLTGGAGADTFAFKAMPWSAGHIRDFQPGVDRIDVSALYANGYAGTNPVADGYVTFVDNGAGGTKVMLDIDAWSGANPWPFTIVTLDGVAANGLTAAQVFGGGSPAPPSPPPVTGTPGVVLTSASYGATLAGGAGNDTLVAGQGPDRLTGGAGADHFTFDKLVWNAGHITDFQHGVDVIDLRKLFADAGYRGGDPIADGYLRLESDGAGGTKVSFDQDGWGSGHPWPTTITTLDGVAPSAVTSVDWLFH